MTTRHYIGIAAACIAALTIAASGRADARGQILPPPPDTGPNGDIGAWLGSGPMFGFKNPWGPGFGGSGDGGGGDDGNFGHIWEPGSGGSGGGIGAGKSGGGCPGTCLRPSWTGPCRYLCMCYYDVPDDPTHHQITPHHGDIVNGRCVNVGDGDDVGHCGNDNGACSFRIP